MGTKVTKERADFATRFKPGDNPKAEKPITIRLSVDVDQKVRFLSNRSRWIEEAIVEKLEREQEEVASAERIGRSRS